MLQSRATQVVIEESARNDEYGMYKLEDTILEIESSEKNRGCQIPRPCASMS
jgi:hypothetical protein